MPYKIGQNPQTEILKKIANDAGRWIQARDQFRNKMQVEKFGDISMLENTSKLFKPIITSQATGNDTLKQILDKQTTFEDKLKNLEMIKSCKAGSISIRKYNPETDPITNVINGIKLEDCHRTKHKSGKFYTVYISKARLQTYIDGEGIMSWLPKIFKGVAKYAPAVVGTISDVVSSHKQNEEQARHNAELEKIARGEGLKAGINGGFLSAILPAIIGAIPSLIDIFSKVGSGIQSGGDNWSSLDPKGGGNDLANTLGSVGNIFGTVMGTMFGSGFDSDKKLAKKITNKMIKMQKSGKTYNTIQFGKSILPGLMRGIVADQKYKGTYENFHKDPFKYPLPDLTPEQQQARIDECNKLNASVGTGVIEALPKIKIDTLICKGAGIKCSCKNFINSTPNIDDDTKAKLRVIFRSLKPIYKFKQEGSAIYLSPR